MNNIIVTHPLTYNLSKHTKHNKCFINLRIFIIFNDNISKILLRFDII